MKKEEKDFTIFDWWKKVMFDNYANFNGRARRKEYWSFQLVNMMILFVPYVLLMASIFTFVASESFSSFSIVMLVFFVLYALIMTIPSLAVLVRRLHDTNRSGWSFLIGLIPFFGSMILLYYYFSDGTVGKNIYGNDPKRPHDEISEIGVSQE